MSTEAWDFGFSVWGLSEAEADEMFERLGEIVCGHPLGTDCPPDARDWVGSVKPLEPHVEDPAPVAAVGAEHWDLTA